MVSVIWESPYRDTGIHRNTDDNEVDQWNWQSCCSGLLLSSCCIHCLRSWGHWKIQPLEEAIHHRFVSALTGQTSNSSEVRTFLSLPTCLSGLNIVNLVEMSECQFKASQTMTIPAKKMLNNFSSLPSHSCNRSNNLCREKAKPLLPRQISWKRNYWIPSKEQWIWPAKKELLHGWPHCHCRRGVSTSTSRNFLMPCACVMVGNGRTFQAIVLVALHFPLTMQWFALMEA